MPTGIYEHKKQTYPQWLITAINIYYTRDGMTIVETAQAIGAGMTPNSAVWNDIASQDE